MQQSAAAANEEVVRLINSDFYMDDRLTGASTEDELLSLHRRVSQTLSNCGFDLRKWATNSSTLIKHIPETSTQSTHLLAADQEVLTLGNVWRSPLYRS